VILLWIGLGMLLGICVCWLIVWAADTSKPIGPVVYCVFSADGCECEFLEDIFSTDELAQRRADELRKDPHVYGSAEFVSVKARILDQSEGAA
jgi:hypothetical protein